MSQRPFRFGVVAASARSGADWVATARRIESLGYATLVMPDGLRYTLSDGARVVVRPSGTEPKLKCYLEVVVPVTTDVTAARVEAAGALAAIKTDLAAAAGI